MPIAATTLLIFQISVIASVFAIGLGTKLLDITSLLSRPKLLARSLLATNILMPLVAILLVKGFHLPMLAGVALIALSLAPMPPVAPKAMINAGGEASYAAGLLSLTAIISLVWIPLAIELIEPIFGIDVEVRPGPLVPTVLATIVVPLIAGALLRRLAPALADRIHDPVAAIAGVALALCLVILVAVNWRGMAAQLQGGVLIAILLFVGAGLLVGHLLGGPREDDRTVLALASAQRHPGIVVVLGKMAAPDESGIGLVALVVLLASTIACLPYIAWRKRSGGYGLAR